MDGRDLGGGKVRGTDKVETLIEWRQGKSEERRKEREDARQQMDDW
jgi:hypothetical protein